MQVLPKLKGSILRHAKDMPGVNSPMMYAGMRDAAFPWHVEDDNLNSISYLHQGEPKTWYGVPPAEADQFEAVVRSKVLG